MPYFTVVALPPAQSSADADMILRAAATSSYRKRLLRALPFLGSGGIVDNHWLLKQSQNAHGRELGATELASWRARATQNKSRVEARRRGGRGGRILS